MRNFFQNIGWNVLSFCAVALVSLNNVSALQSCTTPTNADGYCVPLLECSWYTRNTKKFGRRYPRPFVNYVQKSICFVEGEESIHMCCNANSVQQTTTITIPTTTATSTHPNGIAFKRSADYTSSLNRRGVEILNETNCGYIGGNRIAYGVNTSLFEFPWMALLRYDTNGYQLQCGGSLITTKYVLTAAHCIATDLELIGVVLGEWDLGTNPDRQIKGRKVIVAPPVEEFGIAAKIVHPQYSKYHKINDVALVKLNSEVTFKKNIQPICLPITQESIDVPLKELIVAGWGTTENGTTSNILQKAIVAHQPLQFCQDIFKTDSVNDNVICAGGTSNVDSCKGDSGGPLFFAAFYRQTKRYVQFGIVSYGGIQCGAEQALPGIYASVVQFMPWITSKLD